MCLDVVGGDELVVVDGATVNITGMATLPPLWTVTVTVAEYVPGANPATLTATRAESLMISV